MDLVSEYVEYHVQSSEAKDIDPANDCLKYVCDRFELNIEQRYWLAFLYACCYSGTTTYYIYNEFPDFENVDVNRLQRWWKNNKDKTVFQTDRLKVKSFDEFINIFKSYKSLLNGLTQEEYFSSLKQPDRQMTYDNCYQDLMNIHYFGRFTMFIYLEMVNVLTGFDLEPTYLDLKNAESCRNGLVYALDEPNLNTHGNKKKLTQNQLGYLQYQLLVIKEQIKELPIEKRNIWNIETTLCAYKKYKLGKRYVGYYIERQRKEIEKMQNNVTDGVDWQVLWDFRKETYENKWLKEA